MGNSSLWSSGLPRLCLLAREDPVLEETHKNPWMHLSPVFSRERLSRLAVKKALSHLHCTQTLVFEGALPVKPRLSLILLTTPTSAFFRSHIYDNVYIRYRLLNLHRCQTQLHEIWQVSPDAEGVSVARGRRQGPCLCSCEDCCWQSKMGLTGNQKVSD